MSEREAVKSRLQLPATFGRPFEDETGGLDTDGSSAERTSLIRGDVLLLEQLGARRSCSSGGRQLGMFAGTLFLHAMNSDVVLPAPLQASDAFRHYRLQSF